MSRIQGIGTDFYGKKDYDKDSNSYITIEWFVLFLLPIVPLKAFRVRKISQEVEKNYIFYRRESSKYQIISIAPLKMNTGLILKTYGMVYGFIVLLIASLFLTYFNQLFIVAPAILVVGFLVWYLIKH